MANPDPPSAGDGSNRRHYLDNLRSFLTVLVVVHHTALTYGGSGDWYYESALFRDASGVKLTSPLLLILNAANQSFFMALFFWISGRMSAQSLESSATAGRFVKNKLLRLGVPAIAYTLVGNPFTICMVYAGWDLNLAGKILVRYFASLRGIRGAVWYTALLLVFDLVAVHIARMSRGSSRDPGRALSPRPSWASWYRPLARWGWLAVAACSFLVRLWYPVGKTTSYLIALQPAYVPQYIFAYALGCIAYFADEPILVGPFDPLVRPAGIQLGPEIQKPGQPEQNERQGRRPKRAVRRRSKPRPGLYLVCALAVAIGTLALGLLAGRKEGDSAAVGEVVDKSRGGWSIQALQYALWNEFSFVTIGPALMACFEMRWDRPATSRVWKARYSYAAFLLHSPIIVALDMSVDRALIRFLHANDWTASVWAWGTFGPVLLTVFTGAVGAAASFLVGNWIVQHVPGVKRVI